MSYFMHPPRFAVLSCFGAYVLFLGLYVTLWAFTYCKLVVLHYV